MTDQCEPDRRERRERGDHEADRSGLRLPREPGRRDEPTESPATDR